MLVRCLDTQLLLFLISFKQFYMQCKLTISSIMVINFLYPRVYGASNQNSLDGVALLCM